jgi:hypothetical protein
LKRAVKPNVKKYRIITKINQKLQTNIKIDNTAKKKTVLYEIIILIVIIIIISLKSESCY